MAHCCSVTQLYPLFATLWTAACQASLSTTNSWSLLKLMSIQSVMSSNHLILCHHFSSCPQSFPVSGSFPRSQFFALGGQSIGASASAPVLPMNIQGQFPLRIDWFDFLAVQWTLKGLLQHHNSKASVLQRSAFFMGQHSHPFMATGKTMALTRQTFVGKVISLLFNTQCRFIIAFPP